MKQDPSHSFRTSFGFSILRRQTQYQVLDFGLNAGEQTHEWQFLQKMSGSVLRQSKIGNPKSKMGWGFCNRSRVHGVLGRWPRRSSQRRFPRIGYLAATSLSSMSARTEAFRQGLRELGYVEGKNIVIEYRYAEGKLERVPALATELVHLKVDVIVTAAPQHQPVPPREPLSRFP